MDQLNSLSGGTFTSEEAASLLQRLAFTLFHQSPTEITVIPPSFRHDITHAVDLVEEILRLKGYDSIVSLPLPVVPPTSCGPSLSQVAQRCLAARGFQETITWSFMGEKLASLFGGGDKNLIITNPISQDLSVMRPSLLSNLCQAVAYNESRGNFHTALFERGPQYSLTGQENMASGVRSGSSLKHWSAPSQPVDIFDSKADVFSLLGSLGLHDSALIINSTAPDYYHPGRKGCILQGTKVLAYFGELHPSLYETFDIEGPLVAFEVFLDRLLPSKSKKAPLTLSPYQPVSRDFAFVVDRDCLADKIIKTIFKADRSLISSVTLFDVYEGKGLPMDKKSLALQVRIDPLKETMTEETIQNLSRKIIESVAKAGGVLRTL